MNIFKNVFKKQSSAGGLRIKMVFLVPLDGGAFLVTVLPMSEKDLEEVVRNNIDSSLFVGNFRKTLKTARSANRFIFKKTGQSNFVKAQLDDLESRPFVAFPSVIKFVFPQNMNRTSPDDYETYISTDYVLEEGEERYRHD